MRTIQKISKYEDAKPQKGVWFDYYGEIFVSVLPLEYKPHIRRYAQIEDGKHDNKMSQWHREWQYEKIENSFGLSVGKARTYEIIIDVDGVRHVVDSVVENLAIEFQHSLGVSLEEMDSRFLAHKAKGFVPYLVLDLTEYPISEYLTFDSKLIRKLMKWKKCEYMKAGNVFADLSDCVIRFSQRVDNNHLKMTKDYFLTNLLVLESVHDEAIKLEAERRKVENARIEAQREATEFERQAREEMREQERREEHRREKLNGEDFEYLRKCYSDPIIRPYILEFAKDFFKYNFTQQPDEGGFDKVYSYQSLDSDFTITYSNCFKTLSRDEIDFSHRYPKTIKFLWSEIQIFGKKNGKRFNVRFMTEFGKTKWLEEYFEE